MPPKQPDVADEIAEELCAFTAAWHHVSLSQNFIASVIRRRLMDNRDAEIQRLKTELESYKQPKL